MMESRFHLVPRWYVGVGSSMKVLAELVAIDEVSQAPE